MIDASSKLVTGVLYGNSVDMGNFDECLASGDMEQLGWSGRYALAQVEVAMSNDTKVGPKRGHCYSSNANTLHPRNDTKLLSHSLKNSQVY